MAIAQAAPADSSAIDEPHARNLLRAPLRPAASLAVLDTTEWFGDTSGGIRTYLMQKAQYVAAHPELRQVLVVPGADSEVHDGDGVRTYRVQGPRIPGQAPYRLLLSARTIARVIRHERPHVIEVGSPFIVPWLVRRANRPLRIPIVSYYHANLPRLLAPRGARDSAHRAALHRAAWSYLRLLHRPFALTIASSDYALRELATAGIAPVAHVPLGVDLALFHPHRRVRATATRAQFGLPAGQLAGFIGRFAGEKELPMLLDAWAHVDRATGARLVLVGAGPQEGLLRAHPYGARVLFLPFQSDRAVVANLLAALDVYLSPGRIETFGLASLEALACGTPVLAADEGGVAEQVRRSGAGRLFVAGESESLAEQATALLQDNWVAAGSRGRAYAETHHHWDVVFDRLFDVYRGVVERHGAG